MEIEPKKVINLTIELCQKWGSNWEKGINSTLVETLKQRGYLVDTQVNPIQKPSGEYYIYLRKDNEKLIIFSNNSERDKNKGAIIGDEVNTSNVESVISKLMQLIH